jgi:hypothetical protein
MTVAVVSMIVILLAGVTVMGVATIAHVLDRSRRLRQRLRSHLVRLHAWTCRLRRAAGYRLGDRLRSPDQLSASGGFPTSPGR